VRWLKDHSRGPLLPQRFSPNPRWDARIYPESLSVDCVVPATASNYLLINRSEVEALHAREVLLVCLHPSKGATALQDTSALTIALWPMADP
jgi:hypothetical protein